MQLTVGGLDNVVEAMVLSQSSLFPVLYLMVFVTVMVIFILNVLIGVVISAFRAIEDTTVDTEVRGTAGAKGGVDTAREHRS